MRRFVYEEQPGFEAIGLPCWLIRNEAGIRIALCFSKAQAESTIRLLNAGSLFLAFLEEVECYR